MKYLRKCKTCGIEALSNEDLNKFVSHNISAYGKVNWCISCRNQYHKEYKRDIKNGKKKNKKIVYTDEERKRAWTSNAYKSRYGITLENYEEMLEKQDFSCAICKIKENNGKRFDVDHDHRTGEIRGLLCHKCNKALGLMNDNTLLFHNSIKYLNGEL